MIHSALKSRKRLRLNTRALFMTLSTAGTLALGLAQSASAITPAPALPPEWTTAHSAPDLTLYALTKGSAREGIAYMERKKPTVKEAPKSIEALKASVIENVNRNTESIGVHDWKITTAQALPLDHGKLVKLRGSYIGSAAQKVYFETWKLYLKKGFAQLTFSEEGKDQPSAPEYVESLLKTFKPYGENL